MRLYKCVMASFRVYLKDTYDPLILAFLAAEFASSFPSILSGLVCVAIRDIGYFDCFLFI